MINLFIFQWPSSLGGADTRLVDLLKLLRLQYNITVVPNFNDQLGQTTWTRFLDKLNIRYIGFDNLPDKIEGYALSFCNFMLFDEVWRLQKIKQTGLRFIWSNDMMYHTSNEISNMHLVDIVIYTSAFHKAVMSDGFLTANKELEECIIPNYVDKKLYLATKIIRKKIKKIGKLSRACVSKYSDGFPLFYESIDPECSYKMMGWNEVLKQKYSWHDFDSRWELLLPDSRPVVEFLRDLDLYVYDCHHTFVENQSRSIIESALMGVPLLAPRKWNFPNMITHGQNGFLWNTFEECKLYYNLIKGSKDLREELAFNASKSMGDFTNDELHLDLWGKLLNG